MKYLLATIIMMSGIIGMSGAETTPLPAPKPCQNELRVSEALKVRHSERSFDASKPLSEQQISNLLWAAAGINRPESGKRTNPTALNAQEIDVYVFTPDGVSLYEPKSHSLKSVVSGDHRALIAVSQEFVMDAPVVLLLVADTGRFEIPSKAATLMSMADAGIASENINLFCAANGLATVPRASMDADGLRKLLNLSETQIPALNNPVGYSK
ncbi:MAG: SagB/ThcOx family dehydrogenase [Muribaculaceae bacterium]|jgi:hypothetical protein|nr:SagB/ThcOx family dehydrogenase [Muribaculaceae bacterium]